MSNHIDRVRKLAEKRRKREQLNKREGKQGGSFYGYYPSHDELNEHEPEFYMWREREKQSRPVQRQEKFKQRFFMQWLAALAIFLITAMIVQSTSPTLESTKQTALAFYEEEFQFAAVSNWYETQFGRPLALFPDEQTTVEGEQVIGTESYALPAVGRVTESFVENGKAIVLETSEDAQVTAAHDGLVIQKGSDDTWENVVVVQHEDGSEAWYGTLDSIDVQLYEHVRSGDSLGTVMLNEDRQGGRFTFALKRNNEFIDPNEVMSFD